MGAMRKIKPYCGAGILFYVRGPHGVEVLLAQRRSGVWSLPGGKMSRRDRRSFFACAKRETIEEFGDHAGVADALDTAPVHFRRVRYPFVLFSWVTYLVELPHKPAAWPSPSARDYYKEFHTHQWFPLSALPPRMHYLLWPAILKLRILKG